MRWVKLATYTMGPLRARAAMTLAEPVKGRRGGGLWIRVCSIYTKIESDILFKGTSG